MKAEYRREMNHSYLVLKTDGELNMQGYEMKMLLHNQLAGLLPLSVRYIDGVPLFYYEVTSRQSLLLNYEAKKIRKDGFGEDFQIRGRYHGRAGGISSGCGDYLV